MAGDKVDGPSIPVLDIGAQFDSAELGEILAGTIDRLETEKAMDSGKAQVVVKPNQQVLRALDIAEAKKAEQEAKAKAKAKAPENPPGPKKALIVVADDEKDGDGDTDKKAKIAEKSAGAPEKPPKPQSGNAKRQVKMLQIPEDTLRALANLANLPFEVNSLSTDNFIKSLCTYIYNSYAYKAPIPSVVKTLTEKNGRGRFGFAFWTGHLVQENEKFTAETICQYARMTQRGARYNVLAMRADMMIEEILAQPEIKGRKYMIGKTTCPKKGRQNKKGLIRAGMVKRFGDKYAKWGYDSLIAVAIYDRDSEDCVGQFGYDNPEHEAVETEAALFNKHAKNPNFDNISNIQSGSKSTFPQHEIYAITYLAIGPPVAAADKGAGSGESSKA